MKPLFPDVAERLRVLADEREAELTSSASASAHETKARPPKRSRRPGWRTGTFALIGALAISSGAYAARGLWQPELGSDKDRPTAIAGPPSTDLVERIAVLRRPQSEADRGAASQQALRFPDSPRTGIRTDFVRRVEPAGTADAAVLVPLKMHDGTERLCLWVGPRDVAEGEGGARGCATATKALQGRLVFGTGEMPRPEAEAELAPIRREKAALEWDGQRRRVLTDEEQRRYDELEKLESETTRRVYADVTLRVVGVVPDGVAKVRVGEPGQVVEVHDNTFSVVMPERSLGRMTPTLLDGDGREIPWDRLGVPDPKLTESPVLPTEKEMEQLAVALATNVDPAFANRPDRFAGRIFDSCRQLRHDPPLTQAHQVHHVQRQFQKDIDGFDDQDASLLLEVLRGTYCPIAG